MLPRTRSTTGRLPSRSTSHLPWHIAAHADSAQRTNLEPYEKPRSLLLPNKRLGHEQHALPMHLLPILLRVSQSPQPSLPHLSLIVHEPGKGRGGAILKTIIQRSDYRRGASLRPGRASLSVITLLRTIFQPSHFKTIRTLHPG